MTANETDAPNLLRPDLLAPDLLAPDLLAPRLLRCERDALLPLLGARPDADFDRPTVLPGWSVRDVLAHCSALLHMAATDTMHGFTPEENQVDVEHRRGWTIATLLDELSRGYAGAAAAMAASGGALDGLALGEWLHGGDVRDALGVPDAYASAGIDDALHMVVARSRGPRSKVPPTRVTLTGRGVLDLAMAEDPTVDATARLTTDTATLVRIVGGRRPDPARFTLTGAEPAQYVMFG